MEPFSMWAVVLLFQCEREYSISFFSLKKHSLLPLSHIFSTFLSLCSHPLISHSLFPLSSLSPAVPSFLMKKRSTVTSGSILLVSRLLSAVCWDAKHTLNLMSARNREVYPPLPGFFRCFLLNFNCVLFILFLNASAFKAKRQNKINNTTGVFWRDGMGEGRGGKRWTQKYHLRYNSITASIQREQKGETLPGVPLFSTTHQPSLTNHPHQPHLTNSSPL